MGYKDRTWCLRYINGECGSTHCHLALTYTEIKAAEKWWGGPNFPISMADRLDNGCGYERRIPESAEI